MSTPPLDHERQDVRYSTLLKLWAGLVACLIVVAVVAALVLRGLETKSLFLESGPLAQWLGRKLPPAPRLQQDPSIDLRKLHDDEDALLLHYGWADKAAQRVHIPIDRAMTLVAERGLPSRKANP